MSYFNVLSVSGPNEVDDIHKVRFTPEDSTSSYLENLYKYDFLAPQLRHTKDSVTPNFIQKVVYSQKHLDLILARGDAKQVSNIEWLYFTGHSGDGKFGFFNQNNSATWIPAKDILQSIMLPDIKNIIVSGCGYLPVDLDRRKSFLLDSVNDWSGRFFMGLSSPKGTLWNRDISSILSTTFCVIFDKYVYKTQQRKDKNVVIFGVRVKTQDSSQTTVVCP